MKIDFQKALSFYLTGSTNPSNKDAAIVNPYTDDELAEIETSSKEWKDSEENSFKFSNPALALKADYDSISGYFRNSSLGVFDSLFSGLGSALTSNTSFKSGFALAAGSLLTSFLSTLKKVPFLSTNFSLFDYGARLIRSPLHVFDSTFSQIGEKGAEGALPSVLAGATSIVSLSRILKNNDSQNFKLPNTTVSGVVGRTALHHLESMLASKATQISSKYEGAGAFLASSASTLGLLLPEEIKDKKLPYLTCEGLVSQGSMHFLDSLFANVANSFNTIFNNTKGLLLGIVSLTVPLPLLSFIPKVQNTKASFSRFGGRLIQSVLRLPETLAFNLGSVVGNNVLGIPISLGFAALSYFMCVSKKAKNLFKNFEIPMDTIGGQIQRLPFDFISSVVSNAGMKLSSFIPAPLLVAFGPALSFQIGEKFKGISAKYNDFKGLMARNSIQLWQTILSKAAYKTGRMIINTGDEMTSSGSVLADGRWLTSEGQIVPSMAVGKQINEKDQKNISNILLASIGGVACSMGAYSIGKYFANKNNVGAGLVPAQTGASFASASTNTAQRSQTAEGKTSLKAA